MKKKKKKKKMEDRISILPNCLLHKILCFLNTQQDDIPRSSLSGISYHNLKHLRLKTKADQRGDHICSRIQHEETWGHCAFTKVAKASSPLIGHSLFDLSLVSFMLIQMMDP
uniref:F-box protein n=1 Tax=Cucumis melo TaxID=3656 RepID=A0A9I9EEX1_CUCME